MYNGQHIYVYLDIDSPCACVYERIESCSVWRDSRHAMHTLCIPVRSTYTLIYRYTVNIYIDILINTHRAHACMSALKAARSGATPDTRISPKTEKTRCSSGEAGAATPSNRNGGATAEAAVAAEEEEEEEA